MKYVVGNWKMNMTKQQVVDWFNQYAQLNPPVFNTTVILAPSYLHLDLVSALSEKHKIHVAAQNVSCHEKGTYTGQIGAFQIKDYCTYSLLGHSERQEPQDAVIKKIHQCVLYDVKPIVCFTDIEAARNYLAASKNIVLAFEDPQTISHGGVYTPMDISEIKNTFQKLREILGYEAEIIYGGSTNREIIAEISALEEVDGVLPGNASLDPEHFIKLIAAFE